MNVTPLMEKFILHFGEMGSKWGISRTVGQIYALLYLSEKALNAEEICKALGFSRSNVSMGLKELDSWQLIKLKHIAGDRRDHFTTLEDSWKILRTLVEQKRRREIEPTLALLNDEIHEETKEAQDVYAKKQMQEMHEMLDMFTTWYLEMQRMDNESLKKLLGLGAKVYKLYELKNKLPFGAETEPKKGNDEWN